jgi:Cu+-exporting ATPase
MAAAVEDASEHPLSRAVVERAKREGVPIPKVEGFTAVPGEGLKGIVGGASVSIRSGRSVDAKALSQAGLRAEADRLSEEGKAWSLVEQGGAPLGLLGFFDPPAPGVKEAVAALRADGISVVMLTGDHERAAQRVAAEVGIAEYHAALDPAAKLRYLEDAKQSGRHVAYVGDGINDAPALMAADVGIAIGAGTEVAREAGGVILMRTDFRGVALALRVARRTVSKARGNLFWALGYNSVLLPIAAGILVPVFGFGLYDTLPLAGALAMGLSSTTVLLNSFSLRWIALPTKVSAPA